MIELAAQIGALANLAIIAGVVTGSMLLGSITTQLRSIAKDLEGVTKCIREHENRLTVIETMKGIEQ